MCRNAKLTREQAASVLESAANNTSRWISVGSVTFGRCCFGCMVVMSAGLVVDWGEGCDGVTVGSCRVEEGGGRNVLLKHVLPQNRY